MGIDWLRIALPDPVCSRSSSTKTFKCMCTHRTRCRPLSRVISRRMCIMARKRTLFSKSPKWPTIWVCKTFPSSIANADSRGNVPKAMSNRFTQFIATPRASSNAWWNSRWNFATAHTTWCHKTMVCGSSCGGYHVRPFTLHMNLLSGDIKICDVEGLICLTNNFGKLTNSIYYCHSLISHVLCSKVIWSSCVACGIYTHYIEFIFVKYFYFYFSFFVCTQRHMEQEKSVRCEGVAIVCHLVKNRITRHYSRHRPSKISFCHFQLYFCLRFCVFFHLFGSNAYDYPSLIRTTSIFIEFLV